MATTGMAQVRRLGVKAERRGTLFVSDQRVGVFTKKLGGHDFLDFAFGLLTSVQYKKGVRYGEVTILASGDATVFHMIPRKVVEEMAQLIRQRMAMSRAPATPLPSQPGIADEIRKLADLRASGALTEEEFARQKGRLLESENG